MLGKIFRKRLLTNAVLAGVIGLTVLATCGPSARAADDNDDDDGFDQKIFRSILEGFGLSRDGPGIDYRERSPLVVPPSRTLPPPESSAAVNDPTWPVDPEAKASKAAKAAAAKTSAFSDRDIDESRPLRPDEIRRGTRPRGTERRDSRATDNEGRPLQPSALGYMGGLFGSMFNLGKDETAQFTREPPRTSLIEPPVGYQTPSPNYPYGVTTRETPKAADIKDRAVVRP